MPSHDLALFIPIIALLIPVSAIVMSGLTKLARYRAMGDGGEDTRLRLDQMEQELQAVRRELVEAQERLDFAERLLTRPGDAAPPR